ncbi:MAG TPA: zinc dependent phospholipase C family protein [Methylophilaceae bacterium]|nr:zinc dependent phospholipase C family protein [Methylophilaceae bacterium]
MRTARHLCRILWLTPLLIFAADANAWGLVTHVYFAQSLLWAMPLLDPRLQQAIKRFPQLVMAGACLPDLAIVSPAFRYTHHWENAHHLLLSAHSDEEKAIAIGYASHLYIDVIAHNHFVPAHEAMWLEKTMFTHIAAEWAMDAHLMPLLDTTPGDLLGTHHEILAHFIAPRFRCSEKIACTAILRLAKADDLLRRLHIPKLIYCCMRLLDRRVFTHFVYYIAKTQLAIRNIGIMLEGGLPQWEPELNHMDKHQLANWRKECLQHLQQLHPDPIDYFAKI